MEQWRVPVKLAKRVAELVYPLVISTPKSLEFPQRLFSPICAWKGKTYRQRVLGGRAIIRNCRLSHKRRKQFGSMPVLEEAKTMVYVTNHNMITMAMAIFKTYKMADKGEEKNEYWPKFSFIFVLSSLLFVFLLLWIGKYLEDRE